MKVVVGAKGRRSTSETADDWWALYRRLVDDKRPESLGRGANRDATVVPGARGPGRR